MTIDLTGALEVCQHTCTIPILYFTLLAWCAFSQSYTGGQYSGARGRLRLHSASSTSPRGTRRWRASTRCQWSYGASLGRSSAECVSS